LFMDAKKDSARYARSFFSKLKVPFFNAPGNHDGLLDSVIANDIRLFGLVGFRQDQSVDIDGSFRSVDCRVFEITPPGPEYSHEYFVLNLESSDGLVSISAIERFTAVANSFKLESGGDTSVFSYGLIRKQVFIISHRPIWSEDDPQYSDLFIDNTRSTFGTNYQKDVYPIVQEIAKHAHVYWISGSLGGGAPSSIFFQEHAPNITYIQCAVRDEPRDALLIADVYPDSVHWSALSLTGQKLLAPETYNAAWWRSQRGEGEGFNWRLLPYNAKVIVTHRAFWWGAAIALLIVLLVRRVLRR
ncbi:MAG TPA: hypothetical protein PK760_14910, partial [Flavobacteriales bacterium]|nr:hypothetical protein [Flavobacteriales bacterium]